MGKISPRQYGIKKLISIYKCSLLHGGQRKHPDRRMDGCGSDERAKKKKKKKEYFSSRKGNNRVKEEAERGEKTSI